MDCVTLLEEAREAGVDIELVDDSLVFSGEDRHEDLVRHLAANKPAIIAHLKGEQPPLELLSAVTPPAKKLRIVRLDTVEPKPINWIWPNRIAAGKFTLFAGDPEVGKSTLTVSIAASVTNGWRWPDGAPGCTPGNVLILTAEDGIEDTLAPRLHQAKADLARVHAIQGVEYSNHEKTKRVFNLRSDTPQLVEAIQQVGDVRLVIIDPVSSYLDGIDTNKNGDVRSAMQPLVGAAEENGIAVIIVTHLSKAAARNALSASTGSLAFGALARQAHLAIKDPNDPTGDRRLFLCMKSNICRKPSGLAYSIHEDGIRWDAEAVDIDPDDAMRRSHNPERKSSKADEAKDLLAQLNLDRQSMPAAQVKALAEDKGISYPTLNRAFKDMGGVTKRDGFQGQVLWELPAGDAHTFQEWNEKR